MVLDMPEIESEMAVRQYCLREAAKRNIVLREGVEATLNSRLQAIANKYNAASALKYCTGITIKEKELAISWLGKGQISVDQIKAFYPDMYHYYATPLGVSVNIPDWLPDYMKEYKRAKLSNSYTEEVDTQIKDLNGSEVSFDTWYQGFSTTRTLLQGRGDIEVFYWVDGLGIEWIPLIKEIIREKNNQNIFLNDIKIARAILPSKTDVNKADLQKLLPEYEQLMKMGDLDNLAHQQTNLWPTTIIKEVKLVREIIEDSGGWTKDDNYFRLEDGTTVCALRHKSLCSKVPKGQGIHGGCTPEEVLVPIFIISSYVGNTEWTADILTLELNGANPVVQFRIKNIPSVEIPVVEYDGIRYALHQVSDEIFESEPIAVNENCNTIALVIGSIMRVYNISITTGAKEDDLFGGF